MTFYVVTKDDELCFATFADEWAARSYVDDNIDRGAADVEEQRVRFKVYRCETCEDVT
jgi:hypothetical protein